MGGKTQTTQQASSTTPTGLSQLNSIWNQVQQVASQPYNPYTGQLVAGLSPTQQAGISNINAAQGSAQPYFNQAAQYATAGAAPISASQIQNYQNPYTQQVVDATQAQFNNANAEQQSQLVGNAALAHASGGDRQAVAQAELARQQNLAQNPTIAGLYSNSYNSALGAAQADRAAQGQAAYTFGALAPSVQNAQLQGAQAQIGAGGLEQQTQQAGLSAAYNQYLQQLAFPYQQAGFLASAGLPAVTAMGGSSTGATTSPGPNPWAQVAGLGLAGASLFSDERVKTDKKKVGKTFDGQPIYTFKYKGSPVTHMGLLAQEVEKKHPFAVGESGGIKTVDYDAATPVKKADGGPVGLFDVQTYVPKFGGVNASPVNYGRAPNAPSQSASANPFGSPQSIVSAGKGLQSLFGSDNPAPQVGYTGTSSEAFPGMPDATTGYQGGVSYPIFGEARGGRISGYADGGSVDFDAAFSPFAVPPANTQANRDLALAVAQKYNPVGDIALNAGAPVPRPRPFDAPGVPVGSIPDDGALPAVASSASAPAGSPATNPFIVGANGLPSTPDENGVYPSDATMLPNGSDNAALPQQAALTSGTGLPVDTSTRNPQGMGGWNPFNLSDDARMGLVAAGLGTAASRTPFALSAIGEGGLQGVKTYEDAAQRRRAAEAQANKLLQQAQQFAQTIGVHKDQATETARHNAATEALTKQQRDVQNLQPVKIGTDQLGRDKYAIRDPKSGQLVPIDATTPVTPPKPNFVIPPGPQGEESSIPPKAIFTAGGHAEGTNPDVLNDLPPGAANTVKAIAEGRQSLQTVPMRDRRIYQDYVNQYDPNWDQTVWRARNNMQADMATGNTGKLILATNQLLPHLKTASDKAIELNNTNYPAANTVANWWLEHTGDPRFKAFDTVRTVAATDAARLLRGSGAMSIEEIRGWEERLKSSGSPAQLQSVLSLLGDDLMGARISSIQHQYKMVMHKDAPDFVSPEAKEALGVLRSRNPENSKLQGSPTTQTASSPQDKQALDWASANPNDPRAMAIKKRLGIQ